MANASHYHVGGGTDSTARTIETLTGATSASPFPGGRRHHLPIAVSRSQAYYWKRSWQEAEREALAEIENGRARTFPSAEAAIRYLLGPDDEE